VPGTQAAKSWPESRAAREPRGLGCDGSPGSAPLHRRAVSPKDGARGAASSRCGAQRGRKDLEGSEPLARAELSGLLQREGRSRTPRAHRQREHSAVTKGLKTEEKNSSQHILQVKCLSRQEFWLGISPASRSAGRGKRSFPPEGEPRKEPGGLRLLSRLQPRTALPILRASTLGCCSIKWHSPNYRAAIPKLLKRKVTTRKPAATRSWHAAKSTSI